MIDTWKHTTETDMDTETEATRPVEEEQDTATGTTP